MGRHREYTTEMGDKICEQLADGKSLRAICADDDMPNRATVFRWLADPSMSEFSDQYTRAREDQAEFYAASIIDISDESEVEAKYDGEDVRLDLSSTAVARNRLRVDARKWYASKLAPKKYGDLQKLELTGKDGAPIEIDEVKRSARVSQLIALAQSRAKPEE